MNKKICEQCKKIPVSNDKYKYCSQKCAAISNNKKRKISGWKLSDNSKEKIKNSMIEYYKTHTISKIEKISKICEFCKLEFFVYPSGNKRKYCSKKCAITNASVDLKGKCGGNRLGAGRSKSGYYNGIFCGSTYELAYLIYCIDHGIKIKRYEGFLLTETGRKYFPDFQLEDETVVEIKGFVRKEDIDWIEEKKRAVIQNGKKLLFMDKKDIKKYIEYVSTKYKLSRDKLYQLYDNHKPKYKFICFNCNVEFETNIFRKTEEKFCSKRCSGLYRTKKNFGIMV